MNETSRLLKNSFSKKNIIIALIIFTAIFLVSTYVFIHFDTFDKFYEYTREHEDWELDELILGIFAFFISLSFSLFYLSYTFGKKVIEFTKSEIEQQKRVQASQKLQSMGSMLGGLAHSLNNHLVPIITLSKILKDDISKNNPSHDDISKVLEASYGLRDILKQVLNFTRADNSNLANSCQIDETLENALNLAKTTVPSSIKFESEIEKSDLIIPISRINIEIIIFNLITNAIHALENRKAGFIKTTLKVLEDKSKIVIKVRDNGCGISKEKSDLIFDPFFTTKEQGKGTGLGLSETFGIIKSAKGTIKVDSKENEFTEFTLEIPTIREY
ncbi:sensor histidine kinase [Halarcobacter anaerophilus]|uniref:sensor histidine kinase n=1 Tax=Halarcobacter anaerophilus TaxID=877500 RepID=UPI0005CA06A6|nr:HAMP domain-containing sensor histidine kinase [Halarcobacter anaerophilus]